MTAPCQLSYSRQQVSNKSLTKKDLYFKEGDNYWFVRNTKKSALNAENTTKVFET